MDRAPIPIPPHTFGGHDGTQPYDALRGVLEPPDRGPNRAERREQQRMERAPVVGSTKATIAKRRLDRRRKMRSR